MSRTNKVLTMVFGLFACLFIFAAVYAEKAPERQPTIGRPDWSEPRTPRDGVAYQAAGAYVCVIASVEDSHVMLFGDVDKQHGCSIALLAEPDTGAGRIVLMTKEGVQHTLDAETLGRLIALAKKEGDRWTF